MSDQNPNKNYYQPGPEYEHQEANTLQKEQESKTNKEQKN